MPTQECVPCQTIIWDNMASSKILSVNELVKMGRVPDAWARRWYELMESHCEAMDAMLAELTGEDRTGDPRR